MNHFFHGFEEQALSKIAAGPMRPFMKAVGQVAGRVAAIPDQVTRGIQRGSIALSQAGDRASQAAAQRVKQVKDFANQQTGQFQRGFQGAKDKVEREGLGMSRKQHNEFVATQQMKEQAAHAPAPVAPAPSAPVAPAQAPSPNNRKNTKAQKKQQAPAQPAPVQTAPVQPAPVQKPVHPVVQAEGVKPAPQPEHQPAGQQPPETGTPNQPATEPNQTAEFAKKHWAKAAIPAAFVAGHMMGGSSGQPDQRYGQAY